MKILISYNFDWMNDCSFWWFCIASNSPLASSIVSICQLDSLAHGGMFEWSFREGMHPSVRRGCVGAQPPWGVSGRAGAVEPLQSAGNAISSRNENLPENRQPRGPCSDDGRCGCCTPCIPSATWFQPLKVSPQAAEQCECPTKSLATFAQEIYSGPGQAQTPRRYPPREALARFPENDLNAASIIDDSNYRKFFGSRGRHILPIDLI